jgi:flagellar export protein FliJ
MSKFRFRLAKVLKLRERAEQNASREVGRIISMQLACEKHIQDLEGNMSALLNKRNELQRGEVIPSQLAQNRYQIIVLERSQEMARFRLINIERELSAARLVLLEKNKAKQLLEKLRERQGEEFRMEQLRLECKEQDDRPQTRGGMGIAKASAVDASNRRQQVTL